MTLLVNRDNCSWPHGEGSLLWRTYYHSAYHHCQLSLESQAKSSFMAAAKTISCRARAPPTYCPTAWFLLHSHLSGALGGKNGLGKGSVPNRGKKDKTAGSLVTAGSSLTLPCPRLSRQPGAVVAPTILIWGYDLPLFEAIRPLEKAALILESHS